MLLKKKVLEKFSGIKNRQMLNRLEKKNAPCDC